jgi:hypothetical protein
MPAAVIPFNLTHRAFIIFTFVVMAVVSLLFVIVEIVQNWNEFKKRFAWYKDIHLGELEHRLWTKENGKPLTLKRSQSGLQTDEARTSGSSV